MARAFFFGAKYSQPVKSCRTQKKSSIRNKGPSVDGQAMCTREMGEFLINKHLQIEKMCAENRISEQLSNFKLFNHNS